MSSAVSVEVGAIPAPTPPSPLNPDATVSPTPLNPDATVSPTPLNLIATPPPTPLNPTATAPPTPLNPTATAPPPLLPATAPPPPPLAAAVTAPPPKPSGLKPPSKIGRPCSVIPKPGLPAAATPRANGTVGPATLKKTIPGVPKKKSLEDIEEGLQDGPEPGSKQRTISEDRQSSSGSLFAGLGNSRRGSEDVTGGRKHSSDITSIDALWEHVRRLSEAGVRRMSDASVILTEDTDSFIIGERVWVGGTKPGQIAYIGETQFAPGDWAGIVLDEPVGKNDGSVAGVRYFQCEMRRGVFSRLTRLTRSHLGGEEGDSVSTLPRSNGSASGLTTPTRRLTPWMSPPGSVKDLQLRKGSVTLLGTPAGLTPLAVDLKLGDRVIIMSGQGSKAGTLKYRGTTEFAPGDWCGVELDDPVGKNDGSVEGVRYFKCEPKFGLFAPAHKLSKSPSSRRPSTCQVHQRPGSALKKVGSRESLTSVISTTSSMRGPRVRLGVTSLAQKVGVRTPTSPLVAKTTLQVRV